MGDPLYIFPLYFIKRIKWTKSASVKILQSNKHFEDIWCQIAGNGNAPPLEKNEKKMKKMIQAFSALVKGLRELEWCDPYSLWLRLMAYTPNLPGSCISHTMAFPVVEFSREGYKIRKLFWLKINCKQIKIIKFCKLVLNGEVSKSMKILYIIWNFQS